jgi:hypothetical protein
MSSENTILHTYNIYIFAFEGKRERGSRKNIQKSGELLIFEKIKNHNNLLT